MIVIGTINDQMWNNISLSLSLSVPKQNTKTSYIHCRLKLTVSDAESSDSGRYECEARRDGKTASSTFAVDVHAPVLQALVKGYFGVLRHGINV